MKPTILDENSPRFLMKEQERVYNVGIGQAIRKSRRLRDLTQRDLGKLIGRTFQQIQKYEDGSNRVSAVVIVKIAKVLDMRISDFLPSNGDL